jgi:hypothetical protein
MMADDEPPKEDLTEEDMQEIIQKEEANKEQHQEKKASMLKKQMKVFGTGAKRRSLGVGGRGRGRGWAPYLSQKYAHSKCIYVCRRGAFKEKKIRRESSTQAVKLAGSKKDNKQTHVDVGQFMIVSDADWLCCKHNVTTPKKQKHNHCQQRN